MFRSFIPAVVVVSVISTTASATNVLRVGNESQSADHVVVQ